MKTKICYLLVSVLILTFVSCGNNQQLEAPQPEYALTLLHFTEPSYVNHLIVNDYDNTDSFVLMRGNQCDSAYQRNFSGKEWIYKFGSLNNRAPYIELTDDWYLVDWSWYMYPLNGHTLLTDVTWDNYKGECFFDKSTPHITDNIYERIDIVVEDLIVYSCPDGKYPTFMLNINDVYNIDKGEEPVEEVNEYIYYLRMLTTPSHPYLEENGKCACNSVEELDGLWDVFRQQLIKLIENGDLKSLPSATSEQHIQLLGKYY